MTVSSFSVVFPAVRVAVADVPPFLDVSRLSAYFWNSPILLYSFVGLPAVVEAVQELYPAPQVDIEPQQQALKLHQLIFPSV